MENDLSKIKKAPLREPFFRVYLTLMISKC